MDNEDMNDNSTSKTMKPLSLLDSHRLTEFRKRKNEIDRKLKILYDKVNHGEMDREEYHRQYRQLHDERIKIIQQMKDIRG